MAEINLIDKPVFTHRQMAEMMFVTRSWTLNNPSGPLPYMPRQFDDNLSVYRNCMNSFESMPPIKKPKRIIAILIWLKLI